jgi:DNA polymerase-3 subunit beta
MRVNRKGFLDCLEKVKRAMPNRSTLPAIKNFLISVTDKMRVTASDLDWGVTVSMPCEGQCSFLVAPLLLDIVKSLDDEMIELIPESNSLIVKSSKGETVLNILPPDDYPELPEIEGKSFTIPSGLFSELVELGGTCAIKNPARPLWGAIYVCVQDGILEMVSTDQFSLSLSSSHIEAEDTEFIISADPMKEIARLMSGDVKIAVSENRVSFECDSVKCYSRLIDGKYYAYKTVIPKDFVSTVVCDRKDLIHAVSRAAIVSSDDDRAIRLIVNNGFTVKAGTSEKGHMEEAIESTVEGDPVEVWLQHIYLSKALKGLSADKVEIEISGGLAPMKVSGSEKGFFVIMPMNAPKGV